jgi:hypothetical protein
VRVWIATYRDDDSGSGTVQVWGTSERDVRRRLAEAKKVEPHGFDVYSVRRVTITPTRAGIVDFLNSYGTCA